MRCPTLRAKRWALLHLCLISNVGDTNCRRNAFVGVELVSKIRHSDNKIAIETNRWKIKLPCSVSIGRSFLFNDLINLDLEHHGRAHIPARQPTSAMELLISHYNLRFLCVDKVTTSLVTELSSWAKKSGGSLSNSTRDWESTKDDLHYLCSKWEKET